MEDFYRNKNIVIFLFIFLIVVFLGLYTLNVNGMMDDPDTGTDLKMLGHESIGNKTNVTEENITFNKTENNQTTHNITDNTLFQQRLLMTKIANIILDAFSIFGGNVLNIKALLTYSNLTPIPDKWLNFYINSTLIGSNLTDRAGWTEINWNSTGLSGNYTVNVTYEGDDNLTSTFDDGAELEIRELKQEPEEQVEMENRTGPVKMENQTRNMSREEQEIKIEIKSKKRVFKADENPEFELDILGSPGINEIGIATSILEDLELRIEDVSGKKAEAELKIGKAGKRYEIEILGGSKIKPGLHRLIVEVEGEKAEEWFGWGLLAINMHKSIYLPNEIAFIGISVFSEKGEIVCDADVKLEIINPHSKLRKILSTENALIKISPKCGVYDNTNLPDYYGIYGVSGEGEYEINLTAVIANGTRTGTRTITDTLLVREKVDFDIDRTGPARIYPYAPYVMNFGIKANTDYTGIITERVPASFEITLQNSSAVAVSDDVRMLSWNVDLKKGDVINFSYEFYTSETTPYLFSLGELEIGEWREERHWIIASDGKPVSKTDLKVNDTNNISKIAEGEVTQEDAEIGKPVKWLKRIKLPEKRANFTVTLPPQAMSVSIKKAISKKDQAIELKNATIITPNQALAGRTGRGGLLSFEPENLLIVFDETLNETRVVIGEAVKEIEIGYYTDPPTTTEKKTERGKRIVVTGPELGYRNILTYTEIPESWKIKISRPEKIKLYWLEDADPKSRKMYDFNAYDKDGNGYIDYIEWMTPHLSDQFFEIVIEISKAEHLDDERIFMADIYEEVKALDNNWSEPIYHNEYARVKFRENLTSKNDITVYARNTQQFDTRIEVYYYNSSEKITEFPLITETGYYKVLLTGMQGDSDTFDLRIKNIDNDADAYLEFDYIVDPLNYTKRTCSQVWGFSCSGTDDDTYDNCLDGGDDASHDVVEIYLNATTILTTDTINVTCEINCGTETNDEYYIYYRNSTSGTWTYKADGSCAGSGSNENYSISFYPDNVEGEHQVRCIIDENSLESTGCASSGGGGPSGDDFDNDDVNFTVEIDDPPTVTLNQPVDDYNATSTQITFNCTASDDLNLTSVALYGNWSNGWKANETNSSGINGTEYIFVKNITQPDKYVWNCYACDDSSQCAFASSNRSFSIGGTNLRIWDETDSGEPWGDQVKYANDAVEFYANYTNATLEPLLGASCNIGINVSGGWSQYTMTYNTTKQVYEYNYTTGFSSSGTYNWNVTCNKTGYINWTKTDTVSIAVSVIISETVSPNQTIVGSGENITVYGHINYSNGTDITNADIRIYLNNTLLDGSNLVKDNVNSPTWWNYSWKYRRNLNLSEPNGTARVNERIILEIKDLTLYTDDCTKELRLVNTSGNEENIQVLRSVTTGNPQGSKFCKIAILNNISASGSKELYLYYGNSQATDPGYTDFNRFHDDFENYSVGDSGSPDWTNWDASKIKMANYSGNMICNISAWGEWDKVIYTGQSSWENYTFEMDVMFTDFDPADASGAGFYYRFDASSYKYFYFLDDEYSQWVAAKQDSGGYQNLNLPSFNPTNNVWYHLTVNVSGDDKCGYIDYAVENCINDNSGDLLNGYIAMFAKWSNAIFDNFSIWEPYVNLYETPSSVTYGSEEYYLMTDSSGDYNYTFSAPSSAGVYDVKVNISYGISTGANTKQLEVIQPPYLIVNVTTNQSSYDQGDVVNASGTFFWSNGTKIANEEVTVRFYNTTNDLMNETNATTDSNGEYSEVYTISPTADDGYWNVTVTGWLSPNTTSNSTTFIVKAPGNPAVGIISPVTDDYCFNVSINASVFDSEQVSTVYYKVSNATSTVIDWTAMNLDSGTNVSGYWNATLDTTTITGGSYNVTINATDSQGNYNSTKNKTFNITSFQIIWNDNDNSGTPSFNDTVQIYNSDLTITFRYQNINTAGEPNGYGWDRAVYKGETLIDEIPYYDQDKLWAGVSKTNLLRGVVQLFGDLGSSPDTFQELWSAEKTYHNLYAFHEITSKGCMLRLYSNSRTTAGMTLTHSTNFTLNDNRLTINDSVQNTGGSAVNLMRIITLPGVNIINTFFHEPENRNNNPYGALYIRGIKPVTYSDNYTAGFENYGTNGLGSGTIRVDAHLTENPPWSAVKSVFAPTIYVLNFTPSLGVNEKSIVSVDIKFNDTDINTYYNNYLNDNNVGFDSFNYTEIRDYFTNEARLNQSFHADGYVKAAYYYDRDAETNKWGFSDWQNVIIGKSLMTMYYDTDDSYYLDKTLGTENYLINNMRYDQYSGDWRYGYFKDATMPLIMTEEWYKGNISYMWSQPHQLQGLIAYYMATGNSTILNAINDNIQAVWNKGLWNSTLYRWKWEIKDNATLGDMAEVDDDNFDSQIFGINHMAQSYMLTQNQSYLDRAENVLRNHSTVLTHPQFQLEDTRKALSHNIQAFTAKTLYLMYDLTGNTTYLGWANDILDQAAYASIYMEPFPDEYEWLKGGMARMSHDWENPTVPDQEGDSGVFSQHNQIPWLMEALVAGYKHTGNERYLNYSKQFFIHQKASDEKQYSARVIDFFESSSAWPNWNADSDCSVDLNTTEKKMDSSSLNWTFTQSGALAGDRNIYRTISGSGSKGFADWSDFSNLSFWFYTTELGKTYAVSIKNSGSWTLNQYNFSSQLSSGWTFVNVTLPSSRSSVEQVNFTLNASEWSIGTYTFLVDDLQTKENRSSNITGAYNTYTGLFYNYDHGQSMVSNLFAITELGTFINGSRVEESELLLMDRGCILELRGPYTNHTFNATLYPKNNFQDAWNNVTSSMYDLDSVSVNNSDVYFVGNLTVLLNRTQNTTVNDSCGNVIKDQIPVYVNQGNSVSNSNTLLQVIDSDLGKNLTLDKVVFEMNFSPTSFNYLTPNGYFDVAEITQCGTGTCFESVLSGENYSVTIYSITAEPGLGNNISHAVAADTAPNVTALNYPPNNGNISSVWVDFNFTANDDSNLTNCSLWANFSSSWAENETVIEPTNNSETNITVNPSDGFYIWNVQCWDNATSPQSDFFDSNYTVTIDTTPPAVENKSINETSSVNTDTIVCLNVSGVSDSGSGIDEVWAEVTFPNSTAANISMSDTGNCAGGAGNGIYSIDVNVSDTAGTFYYNATWVNDTAGNSNSNTTVQSLSVSSAAAPGLSVNFIPPTPNDNQTITDNYAIINVSASGATNITTFIDFDSSLMAWWRMDDINSSYDVIDYFGKYNGTRGGNSNQTPNGQFGKAWAFDGDSDYVEVNANDFENLVDFSVSLWFMLNETANDMGQDENLIGEWYAEASPNNDGWNIYIESTDNKAYFFVRSGSSWPSTSSTTTFTDINKWYHLVATFDNTTGNISIYINGTFENSVADPSYFLKGETVKPLYIGVGYSTTNREVNGSIDDIMIFNRTLNYEEIAALYADTSSRNWSVNLTGLAFGNHTVKAYVQDSEANVTNTSLRTFTVSIAPIISNLRNTSLTNQSTYIEFDCSHACNYSILWYNNSAKTASDLVGSIDNNTFATSHSPYLENLSNSTTYFINLTVWDTLGNNATNNTFNFTTFDNPTGECCYDMLAYQGGASNTVPLYKTHNNSGFLDSGSANDVGGNIRWVTLITSQRSTSDEKILCVEDSGADVNCQIWDGVEWTATWTDPVEFTTSAGGNKGFDAAYINETHAMACFRNQSDISQPDCQIWNGSDWEAKNALDVTGSIVKMRLIDDPNSNYMALMTKDQSEDINVQIFNGTDWSDLNETETGTTTSDITFSFDGAWTSSGDFMAVWFDNTDDELEAKIFSKTTGWGSQIDAVITDLGTDIDQHVLAVANPDSANDEIMILSGADNVSNDFVIANFWNGTNFTGQQTLNNSIAIITFDNHPFYLAYEHSGDYDAIVTYGYTQTDLRYRIWDSGTETWGNEQSLPALNENVDWHHLASDPVTDNIMLTTLGVSNDIDTIEWNGTYWEASWTDQETSSDDVYWNIWFVYDYEVEIDEIPPTITTHYPTNTTYYNVTEFNFSATDNFAVDECWYNLGASNISITNCVNGTSLSLSQGQTTLIIYANDTSNNIGVDTTIFTIDWTAPNMANKSINETSAVNNNTKICLNVSGVSDSGSGIDIVWVELTLSNGSLLNLTMSDTGSCAGGSGDGWYSVDVDVGDSAGTFYFNASWVNDTAGNTNSNTTVQSLTVNEECSVAIAMSNTLSTGVGWTVSGLPASNLSANDNNGTGVTLYNVSVSITGSCNADLYIRADGDLTDNGNTIGLGNETYCYNVTNSSVPGTACTPLDTAFSGNQIGSNLGDGDRVYLKFYLSVLGGQSPGDYNNTVNIKGIKAGETP